MVIASPTPAIDPPALGFCMQIGIPDTARHQSDTKKMQSFGCATQKAQRFHTMVSCDPGTKFVRSLLHLAVANAGTQRRRSLLFCNRVLAKFGIQSADACGHVKEISTECRVLKKREVLSTGMEHPNRIASGGKSRQRKRVQKEAVWSRPREKRAMEEVGEELMGREWVSVVCGNSADMRRQR
eukprot:3309453-Rhodomonas_salina.4